MGATAARGALVIFWRWTCNSVVMMATFVLYHCENVAKIARFSRNSCTKTYSSIYQTIAFFAPFSNIFRTILLCISGSL